MGMNPPIRKKGGESLGGKKKNYWVSIGFIKGETNGTLTALNSRRRTRKLSGKKEKIK